MLIAHVESAGVWLIDGGMHRLARAIEALARQHGAVFRYDAPVSEIVVERGRAAGVVLASGERITASAVVCNADPAALAAGTFGATARRAVPAQPQHRRSLSALVWCARGSATGFPLVRHNVFFSPDSATEFGALAAGRRADDPSVYVCAQDRAADDSAPPTGAERFQIIVNAPPTGDTHPLTQAETDQCTQSMRATLNRCGLMLDLPERATVLTTPDGFAKLFPQTGGALYGPASHGWAASFRRPGSRTRIPGLYCAGGSTHPGAGVPMAALSARLAVECLLKDRASMAWSHPGGYAWWYVDAFSADRRFGLTIIAFIGSVFSPYYKLSGRARPDNHCAINVSLCGPRGGAWAMTERGEHRVRRDADHFAVGPSALSWDGDTLGDRHRRDFRAAAVSGTGHGAGSARDDRDDGVRARSRCAPPLASGCAACAGGGRHDPPEYRIGRATAISIRTSATSRWRLGSTTGIGRARI